MPGKRRDSKKRVLRSGESIRGNGKYQYKYLVDGKPKFVYSWRLEPSDPLPLGKKECVSLRELEKKIQKNLDSKMHVGAQGMTVLELVRKYLKTRTGVKPNTRTSYNFVVNLLEKEAFSRRKKGDIKTSDCKLFLIKMLYFYIYICYTIIRWNKKVYINLEISLKSH